MTYYKLYVRIKTPLPSSGVLMCLGNGSGLCFLPWDKVKYGIQEI